MNVYVLMGEWDYEGAEAIAVYSNLDDAKDVLAKVNDIMRRGEEDQAAEKMTGTSPAYAEIRLEREMEEDLAALGIEKFYDSLTLVERELLTS